MKTVFSTHEVAHIWAQNDTGRSGRTASNNFSFKPINGKQTLYSYSATIGFHLTDTIVVLDDHSYSMTTNRHQRYARQAVIHKNVMDIPGSGPHDTALALAETCVGEAVKALVPVTSRKIRSCSKVRWQLAEFYRLTGYLGALSGVDALYHKPIMALVDGMNDAGLFAAVQTLMNQLGSTPQVSQDQANRLDVAVQDYEERKQAQSYTQRYLAAIKEARSQSDECPVRGALYLHQYIGGDNKQLLSRLTPAQRRRMVTVGAGLRHDAVRAFPAYFAGALEDNDWQRAQHALAVFEFNLNPTQFLDWQTQAKQCKYDQLTAELEGGLAEGVRWGKRHAESRLSYWRQRADGDEVLLALYQKGMDGLEQRALEEARELVARWRAKHPLLSGEASRLHNLPTMIRLRAKGTVIETSKGATVPAAVAPQLWQLVQDTRAFGPHLTERLQVGNYTLNQVKPDGSLIIGCHELPYAELALMAQQLGLDNNAQRV